MTETLTNRQAHVLRIIRRHEYPTVGEIADYIDMAPSTARATVKSLVSLGFVAEAGVGFKSSAVTFGITDAGRAYLANT